MNIVTNTPVSFYPICIIVSLLTGTLLQYRLHRSRGIEKTIAGYSILTCMFFSFALGLGLTLLTSGFQTVGLSSMGGLAGMYAGDLLLGICTRKNYYTAIMAENCTIVLPVIYSISKIGCLLAGCCEGIPYQGFGYITYDHGEPLLPVQLLETVVFFVIFLVGRHGLQKHYSAVAPVILVLASLTKCSLDFLRSSHQGQIVSFTQILCIVTAVLGILWLRNKISVSAQGREG